MTGLRLFEAGLDVGPGQRAAGWLTFEDTAVQPARIPVVVLCGHAPGPTVWIQAGLHGDEGDGVVALLRWLESRRAQDLAGTVILVPVANTLAFLAGRAAHPADSTNLNRSFTGSGRTWGERFAAWLLRLILRHANAFVDLHGGGRSLEVADFAFCGSDAPGCRTEDRSWHLARASGVRYICAPPPAHAGALYRVLGTRGIPAVLIEAGGGTTWQESTVARHLRAIDNILNALGVAQTGGLDAPAPGVAPSVVRHTVELWANEDAIVVRRAVPGTIVQLGETVVHVRALTGEARPGITSPLPSAIVLSVVASALLRSGQYACLLGEWAP